MVYRPTVRYADVYRSYVDNLFQVTSLDRNQIIRLALFTAAFSPEFQQTIAKYKTKDVPLPSPLWSEKDQVLWTEKGDVKKENREGGKDVYAQTKKPTIQKETVARKISSDTLHIGEEKTEGAAKQSVNPGPTISTKNAGGIKIVIQ